MHGRISTPFIEFTIRSDLDHFIRRKVHHVTEFGVQLSLNEQTSTLCVEFKSLVLVFCKMKTNPLTICYKLTRMCEYRVCSSQRCMSTETHFARGRQPS
jgi:hypothetical protein